MLEVTGYEPAAGETFKLHAKAGMDGSGAHRARHQRINSEKSLEENPHLDPEAYKNYLLTCFCPLSLKTMNSNGVEVEIWVNSSPNSMSYTRPISLIRAAESRDVIEKEFSTKLQEMSKPKARLG